MKYKISPDHSGLAEALVMGIDTLMGMLRCMNNCLGDVAISVVVAKQEGLLDVDAYNGN